MGGAEEGDPRRGREPSAAAGRTPSRHATRREHASWPARRSTRLSSSCGGSTRRGFAPTRRSSARGSATRRRPASSSTRYREILDRIAAEQLRVNVALKLTHLGLAFDEELAQANVGELVAHAAQRGNFVRLDMEESTYVDATLRVYRALREERSRERRHRAAVVPLSHPGRPRRPPRPGAQPPLRQGRLPRAADVAYPEKADVDAAYAQLVERSLAAGGFTAVATHDEALIAHAIAYAKDNDIPRTRFQFQMLYGVRGKLQLDLVRQGYDVSSRRLTGPTGTAT